MSDYKKFPLTVTDVRGKVPQADTNKLKHFRNQEYLIKGKDWQAFREKGNAQNQYRFAEHVPDLLNEMFKVYEKIRDYSEAFEKARLKQGGL